MPTVRAKFDCISKEHDTRDPGHGSVTLTVVHTGCEENDQFFKPTPKGSILISTLNKETFALFEPGKTYFVDFTPAE
jgi:hypothetical protein